MQTASRITISPTISNVNDIKSLMAYCHYLVMKAQLTGNLSFDGHKPTAEENHVAEQCRVVCEKISCKLNVCRVSEITELLDYYDICYRIGNKTLPDSTFISSQKKRVFKAWKSGDKEISESMIFGIVAPAISYHRGTVDRDYAIAYQTLKEKWISTLKKFARFPDATTYENYQRLALMMRENLDREFGDEPTSLNADGMSITVSITSQYSVPRSYAATAASPAPSSPTSSTTKKSPHSITVSFPNSPPAPTFFPTTVMLIVSLSSSTRNCFSWIPAINSYV